jgi:8-oxo-dGTP diphosphatase
VKVAVAIIVNDSGHILITQRPLHASHGGQWEFPGGKLENEETPLSALKREIKEEVGLDILSAEHVTTIQHTYGIKNVTLLFFLVKEYVGSPECQELQLDLRWVAYEDLKNYSFPEANEKIISMLPQWIIK